MNDITCPYCAALNEVCHDDGQGYEEGIAHEMCCRDCRKNFVYYTAISFDYSPSKADCLNGSAHRVSPWRTLWSDEYETVQSRKCVDCGMEERQERKSAIRGGCYERTKRTRMARARTIPKT